MSKPDGETVLLETDYLRIVRRAGWEFVQRINISGIVVVVPVTDRGELVLVEQYRPPVARRVVELPAGLAGDLPGQRGESLEDAARRELLEETGYRASELRCLFHGPPSPGMTSEELTFFLAQRVQRVSAGGGDASEDIVVHAVPLDRVATWLQQQTRQGKLVDVKVYAGLYGIGLAGVAGVIRR